MSVINASSRFILGKEVEGIFQRVIQMRPADAPPLSPAEKTELRDLLYQEEAYIRAKLAEERTGRCSGLSRPRFAKSLRDFVEVTTV